MSRTTAPTSFFLAFLTAALTLLLGTALADGPLRPGDTFRDCADCPEMVVVPAGSFVMGDLSGEGDIDETPVHDVRINYSFAVGKFEVTQAEWRHVMGNNPSRFRGDDRPVENVSWQDAQRFIGKLTSRTGQQYRLLSEAEWEYAARAGTTTEYHWGNVFNVSKAVSNGLATEPVGSYAPNAFGLYDMHANVWEWVEDCRNENYAGAPTDGSAWTNGICHWSRRVLRGGSWGFWASTMRAANRAGDGLGERHSDGFRVARTLSR
jgi:formylglycine-generating enzyme required for sulfatase activity